MLIAQRPTLTEEVVAQPLALHHRASGARFPATPWVTPSAVLCCPSIPGAAVSSVRIDGVLHEFSTVPGVTEDVTEIILNIKKLSISSENDEPVVAYLRKTGRR